MRVLLLVAVLGLPGCLQSASCEADEVWYLTDRYTLSNVPPPAGEVSIGSLAEAFAVDGKPFLSPALGGRLLGGEVTLELWASFTGAAPPVDAGRPGQGYQWYNQVGSDRTLLPGGVVGYNAVAGSDVYHAVDNITVPRGGFWVEDGQRLRVVLTSLTASDGHKLHVGGSTPSQIRISFKCADAVEWQPLDSEEHIIQLAGNQGLLAGAVPSEQGVNTLDIGFQLQPDTRRLTVDLTETSPPAAGRNDMDIRLMEGDREVWSGGSPATDERMILWPENLRLLAPPGEYTVRVDSYSGLQYEGRLQIVQER